LNLPLGYQYSAVYAGIRKVPKLDLGLIVSTMPAAAAAVFTRNRVQAAPVLVSKRHLEASGATARAILVNAGNANCATRTGEEVANRCCRELAARLQIAADQVLPASTGVIGMELDSGLIVRALPELVEGLNAGKFEEVAQAIMTTDTVMKTASQTVDGVSLAGMTKGAGMIQPNMATTLAFVMTDADFPAAGLREILIEAVDSSYHRISVDGDTSTNDTVVLLANGASGKKPDRNRFQKAVTSVLEDLAQQIVRDGEGARKLITIDVRGARDNAAAARIARAIANSPLVKTAIAGSDPNWGRLISAAGNAGVEFDPTHVDIDLQRTPVCRGGLAAEFSEPDLKTKLDDKDCLIEFTIRGKDTGEARFWTCDFTEKYIEINASYRT